MEDLDPEESREIVDPALKLMMEALCYDDSHNVGEELARALLEATKQSVGAHHGEPYQLQVRYACEDLAVCAAVCARSTVISNDAWSNMRSARYSPRSRVLDRKRSSHHRRGGRPGSLPKRPRVSVLAFALDHGGKTGISGIDAIHVACALIAGAAELITSEKSTKPIHRASGIKVISINP